MAITIRKIRRLVNPQTRHKASAPPKRTNAAARKARPKPAKPNPPTLVTLGYLNPKGDIMKQKKPRPGSKVTVPKRRNPNRSRRIVERSGDVLKSGAYALGGLVLTRQIPQAVLGARNSGLIGYGANIATAVLVTALVGRFGGRAAGTAAGIGGGLYVVERILNEQFTPLGKALSLSGVGDATAHGGLGTIRRAYMPYPVVHDRQGKPVVPPEIIEAARQAIPAAAAPAGLGRFAGRF